MEKNVKKGGPSFQKMEKNVKKGGPSFQTFFCDIFFLKF